MEALYLIAWNGFAIPTWGPTTAINEPTASNLIDTHCLDKPSPIQADSIYTEHYFLWGDCYHSPCPITSQKRLVLAIFEDDLAT
jgi:hypothetical protein